MLPSKPAVSPRETVIFRDKKYRSGDCEQTQGRGRHPTKWRTGLWLFSLDWMISVSQIPKQAWGVGLKEEYRVSAL